MPKEQGPNDAVVQYYDAVATNYHLQYQGDRILDLDAKYPANYFRLQLLLNSFARNNIKRVVEVGVGEGTPLQTLARAGIEVWGFDISQAMVHNARERIKSLGLNESRIALGDIQDPLTYPDMTREGPFDGLIAMGVMPHVEKDAFVLQNMRNLLRPGGRAFVEFRNKLFSLFTMNRHTHDFIVNDLLKDVDERLNERTSEELKRLLRMDMPKAREQKEKAHSPSYDATPARFHNPFETIELFKRNGFNDVRLLWYHYHPTLPWLEDNDRLRFRKEAARLEHEGSGWRGFFLCSAFVVEAVKNESSEGVE